MSCVVSTSIWLPGRQGLSVRKGEQGGEQAPARGVPPRRRASSDVGLVGSHERSGSTTSRNSLPTWWLQPEEFWRRSVPPAEARQPRTAIRRGAVA